MNNKSALTSSSLFNYVFLVGLFLLLMNDHYLKATYGNWWTGKLSDFAGVLILPMFLRFCFGWTVSRCLLLTLICFGFFKSSFSQPLIDAFNALGWMKIGRVVDYSDYVAFLMLPVAAYILKRPDRFRVYFSGTAAHAMARNSLFFLSVFAFVATSAEDDEVFVTRIQLVGECCRFEPIEAQVGAGRIFVPSAFSPNGDGVNDFFFVFADDSIASIDTFFVFSPITGDTLYRRTNFLESIPEEGFDGMDQDSVYNTRYDYLLIATSTDEVREVTFGSVCALPCTQELGLAAPDSLAKCRFSTQFFPGVGFDASLGTGEDFNQCFD